MTRALGVTRRWLAALAALAVLSLADVVSTVLALAAGGVERSPPGPRHRGWWTGDHGGSEAGGDVGLGVLTVAAVSGNVVGASRLRHHVGHA